MLADLRHQSLKKLLPFCSGRVPIFVHPSFYRSLKLRYPVDVGGITRDDRVSTELGTGSLRQADFNVFSAYGSRTSVGVSLLVGRSLDADVDVVFAGDGGRLVVADVAVKTTSTSASRLRPTSKETPTLVRLPYAEKTLKSLSSTRQSAPQVKWVS